MSAHLSLADLETNDRRAPRGGRERRFLCPLCGDTKARDAAHRSLVVNTQTGAWLCHRCGERGLLTDNWTDRAPQSRRDRARAAVSRAFALPPRENAPQSQPEAAAATWRAWWETSTSLTDNGAATGAAYVAGRGLPADVASAAGVRFSAAFYGRPAVLFPVQTQAGALVAVSGRFIDGRANPKTQTAGKKSGGVFATPGALDAPLVAVCEAPMDALSLHLCGIPVVALIGTSWPEWLPAALVFRSVLLATDADKGGDDAAVKLQPALEARGARTLRLRPRGGKDWSELLEKRGAAGLRAPLAPFSATMSDERRGLWAAELHHAGRIDAAQFVAGLMADAFAREQVRQRLRQSVGGAVGALPDTLIIPADVPNDEASLRRCIDAQREPVPDFGAAAGQGALCSALKGAS
ncbi:MAG: toprim domain-containing protein [Acidobacteria bacterium]|nr:toprim domain-containing protein [Acidobacteriota bacterium]